MPTSRNICRFGPESDVYIFRWVGEGESIVYCANCKAKPLPPDPRYRFAETLRDRAQMKAHLQEHLDLRHRVPAHICRRLGLQVPIGPDLAYGHPKVSAAAVEAEMAKGERRRRKRNEARDPRQSRLL